MFPANKPKTVEQTPQLEQTDEIESSVDQDELNRTGSIPTHDDEEESPLTIKVKDEADQSPLHGLVDQEEGEEIDSDEDFDQDIEIDINPPAQALRRSLRDRRPPVRFEPGANNIALTVTEPRSYKDSIKSPQAKQWAEACRKELKNIEDMGVWDVVDRPRDAPVVGGKWHFKIKYNLDGSVAKF